MCKEMTETIDRSAMQIQHDITKHQYFVKFSAPTVGYQLPLRHLERVLHFMCVAFGGMVKS